MNRKKFEKSQFKGKLKEAVKLCETIRFDKDNPRDVTFEDVIKEKYNITLQIGRASCRERV